MTLIAAWLEDEHYHLAADTKGTAGNQSEYYRTKIRTFGPQVAMACAGDPGPSLVFEAGRIDRCKVKDARAVYKHVWAPYLNERGRYAPAHGDDGVEGLVVTPEGIFICEHLGAVYQPQCAMVFVGSGSEFATGFVANGDLDIPKLFDRCSIAIPSVGSSYVQVSVKL